MEIVHKASSSEFRKGGTESGIGIKPEHEEHKEKIRV
jgi:hypothetical protein